MSQAVEAFRQISWLIFKWLLIAVGVLIALALLLGGGVWASTGILTTATSSRSS
jgi:hypothetical protein